MDIKGIRLLDRLGPDGLRLALRHSLDRSHRVDLANACKVRFPGKRAQTIDDDRILDELVKRFLEEPAARVAVMKALIRANADLIQRFGGLTGDELAAAVAELGEEGSGRALFALAEDDRETARALLAPLLPAAGDREAAAPGPADPAAPEAERAAAAPDDETPRLREANALLRDRAAKAAESLQQRERELEEAAARETALQREIHAARAEAHRLGKELDRLKEENARLAARPPDPEQASPAESRLEELSLRMHQIMRDIRRIGHDTEELARGAPAPADSPRPYLDALASSVDALRRDLALAREEREEGERRLARALADLAAETRSIHSELAQFRRAAAEPAPRRRGEPERVGLFVDVQNMYYAARQMNARLDFGALMAAATRDRRLIRAIAYVVQNRDIDQSGFLAMLQQKNYEVRRKDLKIRHDGSSKGDWDMEMALDILRMAENLDVVVLVSGDGDFASLVTQIKTLGPKVEVYSFPGSTAKDLMEAADRHVAIDEGFLIRMTPSV